MVWLPESFFEARPTLMHTILPNRDRRHNLLVALIVVTVIGFASQAGSRDAVIWLAISAVTVAVAVFFMRPLLGLYVLIVAALVVPLEFSTGTEVKLNTVTVFTPFLAMLWLLNMVRRSRIRIVPSTVNLPLILFLAANLLSLIVGRMLWDPLVPVRDSFVIVQLAQWGIFVFCALAFWLGANLVESERTLWRLIAVFLIVAGGVAIVQLIPTLGGLIGRFKTQAFIRAPLWTLLAALAAGQLLWNRRLSVAWQVFLVALLFAIAIFAFDKQREAASTWVGVAVAWGVLVWLRFPRLRLALVAIIMMLGLIGILLPTLWEFAGGDVEWTESGESRLLLIERVVEVTMRNPITGLGPAAYRVYASWQPLEMASNRLWLGSVVSSHNNYVDIFAHGGVVALAIFGWFVIEYAKLGVRLLRRNRDGFAGGYIASMFAVGTASLVIMALADWMLPFVYNIGFHGFQASVLVWLFLGGMVSLDKSFCS